MTETSPTQQRCPGNELNKSLHTFSCVCESCGASNEIFSDELGKSHHCTKCGKDLRTDRCQPD